MKIIIFTICCFSFFSCKTIKTVLQQTTKDSLIYRERITIDTLKIKSDTIKMVINTTDTVFHYVNKQGRAKIEVEKKNGQLTVTATCDSIEKLLLSKNIQIEKYKNESTLLKEEISKSNTKSYWYWWFLAGLLVSYIVKILFKIIKLKWSWLKVFFKG